MVATSNPQVNVHHETYSVRSIHINSVALPYDEITRDLFPYMQDISFFSYQPSLNTIITLLFNSLIPIQIFINTKNINLKMVIFILLF